MSQIRFPGRAALANLLFAILPLSPALAVDFCVANASQFRTALQQSANNNSNDEIRLQSGVFQVNDGENGYAFDGEVSRSLVISGGWNSACTSQTGNAESTVLEGNHNRPLLKLQARPHSSGQLILRYLTFRNGFSVSQTGGLFIHAIDTASLSVTVESLIVRGNSSLASLTHAGGLTVVTGGGQLRIRNSLFTGNSGTQMGAISLFPHGESFLTNSTIIGNSTLLQPGGTSAIYLAGTGGGQITLSNNVIDNNQQGNNPVSLRGDPNVTVHLFDNLIRGVRSGPPPATETGTIEADPRFVANSLPVPLPDSPLRNSGRNHPLGGQTSYDLAGLPRVQEGRIDIGAYEFSPQVFDEIFANGVELP